jgi:hypothetical protein
MLRLIRRSLVFLACSSALAAPRLVLAAGSADACVAASEHAQELRNAGKLTAAREELVACSKPECPKIVQEDCTRWMGEVLASLPSVVPAAKDANGKDVVEGKFLIDGKVATDSLDGKPVSVDTGLHVFRIESRGMKPVEERVVVRAGEQNRVITMKLDVETAPPPMAPSAPPEKSKPLPVLPLALGAAGVVLLGVALYMDLAATGDAHDLRNSCAPTCAQGDVDDIKTKYTIAGIGAGVGAAALIAGGVLYVARKNSDAAIAVAPLVGGGAVAQGRISF